MKILLSLSSFQKVSARISESKKIFLLATGMMLCAISANAQVNNRFMLNPAKFSIKGSKRHRQE
ncbi:MAG: hypothetical protein MR455_00835 [Prevotella sp.]|nr:hypothetical protein [Prevotella sp.]